MIQNTTEEPACTHGGCSFSQAFFLAIFQIVRAVNVVDLCPRGSWFSVDRITQGPRGCARGAAAASANRCEIAENGASNHNYVFLSEAVGRDAGGSKRDLEDMFVRYPRGIDRKEEKVPTRSEAKEQGIQKNRRKMTMLLCPNVGVLRRAGCFVGSAPTTFVYMQALVTVRALGGARARCHSVNMYPLRNPCNSVEKPLSAKRSAALCSARRLMEACDGRMRKSGYQPMRTVTGGGSRRHPALKLPSKSRRSSKSPIK